MNVFRYAAAVAVTLALSACAKQESVTAANGPPAGDSLNLLAIASGTALPAGYKVDTGRTMIIGTDERWTGRLSYSTKTNADDVFAFLHQEMPKFGWAELTAMRSDSSVMTFASENTGRMATITIQRGSVIAGTQVDMVVAPHQTGARTAGAPATSRPLSQPLK